MDKFEYKRVSTPFFNGCRVNAYGEEGWELIGVIRDPFTELFQYCFKRKIENKNNSIELKVEVKDTMALFVAIKCAPKLYKLSVYWDGKNTIKIKKLNYEKSLNSQNVENWIKDKTEQNIFNILEYIVE